MSDHVAVLHLWGVGHPAAAVLRVATDRFRLGRVDGLRFARWLGTGSGETFTPRDADPRHWALLTSWDSRADADRFERHPVVSGWGRISDECLRVVMRPLAAHGRWSGREPFEPVGDPRHDGPVAAVTRARLRPRRALTFWRAVPPVVAELHRAPGVRLTVGVGEAPIGFQGTFSVWDDARSLTDFAYRGAAHLDAVARTASVGWYAEDLFARFAVLDLDGTYRGVEP